MAEKTSTISTPMSSAPPDYAGGNATHEKRVFDHGAASGISHEVLELAETTVDDVAETREHVSGLEHHECHRYVSLT